MNILITGASHGIGKAEAQLLGANTKNKLFLVSRTQKTNKNVKAPCKTYQYDLSETEDIRSFANELSKDTRSIDAIVHNVGTYISKKLEDLTDEEIDTTLDLNLRSHILLTKKLLPLLRRSKNPQLVFMSSMAAHSSIVGESLYGSTKAGVTNFANALRNELFGKVKVSTIHAWGVNTYGLKDMKPLLKPFDIAEAVAFILSRPGNAMIERMDLGSIHQWRGGHAPWSP